jgi:hypothetical protein
MAFDTDVDAVIDVIAGAVNKERCILFLGAGVHAPPPPELSRFEYPAEQRPPIGASLSRMLADGCHLSERFPNENRENLQRVAGFYQLWGSRKQLVDTVTGAVQTGKRPSPMLRALAELGFPLVITTNYDRLFESALTAEGRQPHAVIYNPKSEETTDDYPDPTAENPVVFKIHGDIEHRDSLVITDEDYINFVLRMSDKGPFDPVPLGLKFFLTRWTTLFVGYSLLDYNLRLLFQTLRWRIDHSSMPDVYSVDYHPDPLIFDVWHNQRKYVKFIAEDVWKFVPRLYERVLGKEFEPSPSRANVP